MARVTIERTLDKCESRFELAVLVGYRAHRIACGEPTVIKSTNKFAVAALREIEQGKIDVDQLRNIVIEKYALDSQVNTATNSFMVNDYYIKENENANLNDQQDNKIDGKNAKLNISKDYFA